MDDLYSVVIEQVGNSFRHQLIRAASAADAIAKIAVECGNVKVAHVAPASNYFLSDDASEQEEQT